MRLVVDGFCFADCLLSDCLGNCLVVLLLVVACLWMVVLHGWWFGDSVAGVVLACWILGSIACMLGG